MKKISFFSILIIILIAFPTTCLFAQERTTNSNNGHGLSQYEREKHVSAEEAMNVGYAFMRTGNGMRGDGTRSSEIRKQAMQLVYTGRATDTLTRQPA